MKKSDEYKEIAKALLKSQIEVVQPKKDSKNPFYKSNYCDLATSWEACKEILNNNGIFCSQTTKELEQGAKLVTTLMHAESGQWMSSDVDIKFLMPADKNHANERIMTPQECGSAITYWRRYSLCNIMMLCPEDDDGNLSSKKSNGKEQAQETLTQHTLGPNHIAELSNMIRNCPQGFEQWLLAQVIKDPKTALSIQNVPIGYYDFCKKSIEAQLKKQGESKNNV